MTAASLLVFCILKPASVGILIPNGVRTSLRSILPYSDITLVPLVYQGESLKTEIPTIYASLEQRQL